MGNTIIPAGDNENVGASRWMKAAGIAIGEEHYRQVADAKDIDRKTYTASLPQDYLKPEMTVIIRGAWTDNQTPVILISNRLNIMLGWRLNGLSTGLMQ